MRSDRFKQGDLAWITQRRNIWVNAMVPCKEGYPKVVNPKPGEPVTIIRPARASDYGIHRRHTYKGVSSARGWAMSSWLVLAESGTILIKDDLLCKRRFTRK